MDQVTHPHPPEIPCRCKAAGFGQLFLGHARVLSEQLACPSHAQLLLVVQHADAGVLHEQARQMPGADASDVGQLRQ